MLNILVCGMVEQRNSTIPLVNKGPTNNIHTDLSIHLSIVQPWILVRTYYGYELKLLVGRLLWSSYIKIPC